jgi:hypothetical protein
LHGLLPLFLKFILDVEGFTATRRLSSTLFPIYSISPLFRAFCCDVPIKAAIAGCVFQKEAADLAVSDRVAYWISIS